MSQPPGARFEQAEAIAEEAQAIADAAIKAKDFAGMKAAAARFSDACDAIPRDFSKMDDRETCERFADFQMRRASLLFSAREDQDAWMVSRDAVSWSHWAGLEPGSWRMAYARVVALRLLTLTAYANKAWDEARLACGTGLSSASVACDLLKDPPAFVHERDLLQDLHAKLGGDCPVWLGDGAEWPFDERPDGAVEAN